MNPPINIYEILRTRYKASEYALMAEVRDAAGFGASRSADYILMNLWPSRGLHLSAIELKRSRTDWLRELKDPRKAENIFKFVDYFWLLTTDDTIAKLDEIPANWGWMAIKGQKIFTMKEAPTLKPVTINRDFLAALLKRAVDKTEFVHVTSIEDRIKDAHDRGVQSAAYDVKRSTEHHQVLRKQVDDFEKAAGFRIDSGWIGPPAKTGAAVKFILDGGLEQQKKDLIFLEQRALSCYESIKKALAGLQIDTTTKP